MLDVLTQKETDANEVLGRVKLTAKEFLQKVIENNLSWKGNWPVDHRHGVLVRVDDKKYTKFFKTPKQQDDYINSLFCEYRYTETEVLVEIWVYKKKPEHSHDVYVN